MTGTTSLAIACGVPVLCCIQAIAQGEAAGVGHSPFEPEDEIARLNLMRDTSRLGVRARIDGGPVHDLSVDYFIGRPPETPATRSG